MRSCPRFFDFMPTQKVEQTVRPNVRWQFRIALSYKPVLKAILEELVSQGAAQRFSKADAAFRSAVTNCLPDITWDVVVEKTAESIPSALSAITEHSASMKWDASFVDLQVQFCLRTSLSCLSCIPAQCRFNSI